jgi:hypothetical protein
MISSRRATSLIDLVISIGIIAVLFGGIYLVYFSILTAINNIDVRAAATTVIGQELETIRNLPYDSVGTVGGIPAGVIPQTQTAVSENYSFSLQTTVRNIDDPFDGTLGGTPNDTAPADYKLVSVDATCPLCNAPIDVEITTTVAPKNLESATQNGSLFLYAIDANGNGVSGATVNVVDASVTPSINLTDTTNASGVLELVGVPTSTQSYAVTVTKDGYSTDQTNAAKPKLTVVAQTVTAATFAIDRVSQLTVYTSNNRCVPVGSESFSIQGTKLISTSPVVYKFSTSSATNASGTATLQNIEWDTYSLNLNDAAKDLAGTIPLDPIAIVPGSTVSLRFISQPVANPALLVNVIDGTTGAGISNANVTISKAGFSSTLLTDHATLTQTDWSGSGEAGYANQSGGIDAVSKPGALTLFTNTSGTYATGTLDWLISNTFDLGGASSTLRSISWDPVAQPAQTGANSIEFQVAANNDNATWNFIGPDGTSNTFFSASGTLPASLVGDRYLRYQVHMTTADPNYTSELDDVSFDFAADCVPPAQVLFTSLPQGTYTVDVTAQNYSENSTTVSVGAGFQSSTLLLVP